MADVLTDDLPIPESDDLGRYLEDTITIDWQTPAVSEQARELLAGRTQAEDRIRALFEFVRDEIRHSDEHEDPVPTCSASSVLRERTGLCYAKTHLLAALLRFAGWPTGFCYARLARDGEPGRFVLHGFNAVYWSEAASWIFLDPRGDRSDLSTELRFAPPWSLAWAPDPRRGESFLPAILRRPPKRIIDLLERAPDFEAIRRNLPGEL